jgi:hypothetical protein
VEIVRYGDVCHLTGEVKYFLSKVNVWSQKLSSSRNRLYYLRVSMSHVSGHSIARAPGMLKSRWWWPHSQPGRGPSKMDVTVLCDIITCMQPSPLPEIGQRFYPHSGERNPTDTGAAHHGGLPNNLSALVVTPVFIQLSVKLYPCAFYNYFCTYNKLHSFKILKLGWLLWLTSVIPATWEAEIRRITVQGQPRGKS